MESDAEKITYVKNKMLWSHKKIIKEEFIDEQKMKAYNKQHKFVKSNKEMKYMSTLNRIENTQGKDEELLTYFQTQYLKELFTKTIIKESDGFDSNDSLQPRRVKHKPVYVSKFENSVEMVSHMDEIFIVMIQCNDSNEAGADRSSGAGKL